jgi:hypothetical protein
MGTDDADGSSSDIPSLGNFLFDWDEEYPSDQIYIHKDFLQKNTDKQSTKQKDESQIRADLKHRENYIISRIIDRHAGTDHKKFQNIFLNALIHHEKHNTEINHAPHKIFLLNPFMTHLVGDTNQKFISGANTSSSMFYALYLKRLQDFLVAVKSNPTINVTVLDKPDLYAAGTSYWLEKGLVNNVVFTSHNDSTILIPTTEKGLELYSSIPFLYDADIYVAGQYSEDIETFVGDKLNPRTRYKKEFHDHIKNPSYKSLRYIEDLIVDTPLHPQKKMAGIYKYVNRLLNRSTPYISSQEFLAQFKDIQNTYGVIPLKKLDASPDDLTSQKSSSA